MVVFDLLMDTCNDVIIFSDKSFTYLAYEVSCCDRHDQNSRIINLTRDSGHLKRRWDDGDLMWSQVKVGGQNW